MTIASPQDLLETSPQLCPTPIDADFYEAASARLREVSLLSSVELGDLNGLSVDVTAGSGLRLTLVDGPQIVNVWAYNQGDPDERIWHESVIREGIFLRRHTRVWGTMARYRPLLTVLEDSVVADPGLPAGQHHPYFGGSGTPSDWNSPAVPPAWQAPGSSSRSSCAREAWGRSCSMSTCASSSAAWSTPTGSGSRSCRRTPSRATASACSPRSINCPDRAQSVRRRIDAGLRTGNPEP